MKAEIILCAGTKGIPPVIIKTETVERPNLKNYGGGKEGKRSDHKPTVSITLPRIDALRKPV